MIFESKPVFSPRPWGDPQLNEIYKVESSEPIGEVWLLSDFNSMRTPLESGEKTTYPMELTEKFVGRKLPRFPLLIKYISATQWLSVQVHPDDAMAKKVEAEPWGKSECWYFLKDSTIAMGLKKGEIETPVEKLNGESLNYVDVSKGDLTFIPAGTVHAIGPGTKLIEIQQTSDLTYRIFDWGRARELHIEKSRQSIKPFAEPQIEKKMIDFNNAFFKIKMTKKVTGTGLFVAITDKPRLFFIDNDSFETELPGLWITLGNYWKN